MAFIEPPRDISAKPSLGYFEPRMASPEWDWFWKNQVKVLPLWERGGAPFDLVIGNQETLVGSPAWQPTVDGIGVYSNGTNSGLDLGDVQLGTNWTMIWVGIPASVGTATSASVFAFDDFGETDISSGRDTIHMKQTGTGSAANTSGIIEVNVGGTGALYKDFGLTAGVVNILGIRRAGSTVTVFLNGVNKGSFTVGSATGLRTYQFGRIGCHRYSGSNQEFAETDHLLFGVFDRAWSDEEFALHANDPYGPFRPYIPIVTTEPVAITDTLIPAPQDMLLKPMDGYFEPGMADPKWDWMYEGVVYFNPFQHRGGSLSLPVPLTTKIGDGTILGSGGSLIDGDIGEFGPGLYIEPGIGDRRIEYTPINTHLQNSAFTLLWAVEVIKVDASHDNFAIGQYDPVPSGPAYDWGVYFAGTGTLQIYIKSSDGTVIAASFSNVTASAGRLVLGLSYDGAGSWIAAALQDGSTYERVSASNGAKSGLGSSGEDFTLGGTWGSVSGPDMRHQLVTILDHAVTQNQLDQFVFDPFDSIRSNLPLPVQTSGSGSGGSGLIGGVVRWIKAFLFGL